MARLFDAYVMVDWRAAARPKRVMEFHARRFCLSTFLTRIDNTLDLALLGPWHLAGDEDGLLPAELGEQATMIGAARLAWERLES